MLPESPPPLTGNSVQVPNLECFITRIGQHPERLQNVYFDYVLLLRALNKSAQYLASFDICSGDDEADRRTKEKLKSLARTASSCPSTFDEKSMFSGPGAQVSIYPFTGWENFEQSVYLGFFFFGRF